MRLGIGHKSKMKSRSKSKIKSKSKSKSRNIDYEYACEKVRKIRMNLFPPRARGEDARGRMGRYSQEPVGSEGLVHPYLNLFGFGRFRLW